MIVNNDIHEVNVRVENLGSLLVAIQQLSQSEEMSRKDVANIVGLAVDLNADISKSILAIENRPGIYTITRCEELTQDEQVSGESGS